MYQIKIAFRAAVVALVLVTCGNVLVSHAQQQGMTTVKLFLDGCGIRDIRSERLSANSCFVYVMGMLEGIITTETRNGIPHRYCFRGALYGEIADAYLSHIFSEQVKGNYAIFSQINTVAFINFIDARYRC